MTSEMSTGDLLNPPRDGLHLGLKVGDSIGPYRLLSVLGEGGFGVVYVAERREPIVQRVALKVIKPGMDSKAVIARFEQERQALAVMDHPNVAKVYDAGATSEGRPYFVMEHVQGEPITKYCDRHNLTIRQRLELFVPVCEAVQHAHMKGIIHRDIKPSNILVMVRDGKPIPKVIDFGVAKAISHTLTEKTIFTEHGQLIGTPEYMSPEQAEMGAVDIDTRSDVYSLGVVLYELLIGALPFDPRELRSKGYDEIRRIIREVDPPKPSTRLTSMHESTAAIAKHRQAKIDDLVKELSRELDWIPLKAMRKDRTERYGAPLHLAQDIRRYLNSEPIDARSPNILYVARKFIRRRRKSVTLLLSVAALLLGALYVSGYAYVPLLALVAVSLIVMGGVGTTVRERRRTAGYMALTLMALVFMVLSLWSRDYTATVVRQSEQRRSSYNHLHSIADFADLLYSLGAMADAERYAREAVDTVRRLQHHDSTLAASQIRRLGKVLAAQFRFAEAERYLLEAYVILNATDGSDRQRDHEIRMLASLYESWHEHEPNAGHDAQAAKWRAKLAELESSTE